MKPSFFPLKMACATTLACSAFVTANAQTNITVDATKVVRTVDDRLFGVNTAAWDSQLASTETVQLLAGADVRALRFPGGSTADDYNWETNKNGASQTFPTTFDTFASAATALHSQVYITINYGSGTVQLASDWVKHSLQQGYGFKYWEIGNENYGSWEVDNHPVGQQWDPVTYANAVKDYITAMKAIDPTIKIGVVAEASEDALDAKSPRHVVINPRTSASHSGWTPVMLATLKTLGVTPDFLIYHRYEQAPAQESDATLLQAAKTWGADAASLRQMLTDYLGTVGASVELDITENNSVYSNPGKQSVSLVNGLYLADSTAQVLQTEFNSLLWWDLHNGQDSSQNNSSSLYGWRQYGDYGILNPGSTDAYPVYYAIRLLSQFARGGDNVIQATSDSSLLSAYATQKADGSLAILVINKSPTSTTGANISLTGFSASATATVDSYGIPQDNAAKTPGSGSPDIATSSLTVGGSSFTTSFAPYSASVIILYPHNPLITHQPATQTVAAGSAATFSVTAAGDATLSYQWNFNGSPITGATAATYSVSNAQAANIGSYSVTVSNGAGTTASVPANLSLTGVTAPAVAGRLVNLSARAQVGTGGNILITGFVLGGAPGGSKQLLIRGAGPAFIPQGLTNVLAQPSLSLYSGPNLLLNNTGWSTNSNASEVASTTTTLGANPFPANSPDSALLTSLSPGSYTAEVFGVNSTTGNALAELYEVDTTDAFPLVNLSARAFVGTGNNILIAGFVVRGSTPVRLLLRASGPALTSYGVTGVLKLPTISIYSGATVIASNLGWTHNSAPDQVSSVSGTIGAFAFPYFSLDSSLYLTLQPGVYTAQVSGGNGTTGVSLVEVYLTP